MRLIRCLSTRRNIARVGMVRAPALPRQSRFGSKETKEKKKKIRLSRFPPTRSFWRRVNAQRTLIFRLPASLTSGQIRKKIKKITAPTMVIVRHRPSPLPSHEIRKVGLWYLENPHNAADGSIESSSRIWSPNGEPNTSITRSMALPCCIGAIPANLENLLDG